MQFDIVVEKPPLIIEHPILRALVDGATERVRRRKLLSRALKVFDQFNLEPVLNSMDEYDLEEFRQMESKKLEMAAANAERLRTYERTSPNFPVTLAPIKFSCPSNERPTLPGIKDILPFAVGDKYPSSFRNYESCCDPIRDPKTEGSTLTPSKRAITRPPSFRTWNGVPLLPYFNTNLCLHPSPSQKKKLLAILNGPKRVRSVRGMSLADRFAIEVLSDNGCKSLESIQAGYDADSDTDEGHSDADSIYRDSDSDDSDIGPLYCDSEYESMEESGDDHDDDDDESQYDTDDSDIGPLYCDSEYENLDDHADDDESQYDTDDFYIN